MRELTIGIRFTSHSLGSVKDEHTGHFKFAVSPQRKLLFLASWHRANMRFAAKLLGKHQDEVDKIHWDIELDAALQNPCWFERYYEVRQGKQRYCLHQALFPGQVVGINCVVPPPITDDDLWQLQSLAGRYRGLSPWKPGDHGHFEVISIRPRRTLQNDAQEPPEASGVIVAETGLPSRIQCVETNRAG
jgi:hypothetical protein